MPSYEKAPVIKIWKGHVFIEGTFVEIAVRGKNAKEAVESLKSHGFDVSNGRFQRFKRCDTDDGIIDMFSEGDVVISVLRGIRTREYAGNRPRSRPWSIRE